MRRSALLTAAALAVVMLAAGCASTTSGAGTVAPPTAVTSAAAPTDFPSSIPPFSTPAPTSGFPTSGVPSSALPSSAPPGSRSPAPAPEACIKSKCKLVKSWDVGAGYIVAVFSAADPAGGVGSSVLLLGQQSTPIEWHVIPDETPSELLCKVAVGERRNCVLVDFVGAHAATAYPLLVSGDHLVIGKSVGTDTPALHAVDLDHDLLVDAMGLNNNYKPNYAAGHVQWQTWRRMSDALTLSSTGCGPLRASAPPKPNGFVTGTCDFG